MISFFILLYALQVKQSSGSLLSATWDLIKSSFAVDAVKVTVSSEKVAKEDFIKSQIAESNEPEDCLTCSA